MSTLRDHLDSEVDLESAESNGGAAVGGPPSAVANEIVESNGGKKDKDEKRDSNFSECSVEIVDLELGVIESKVLFEKSVKDCRICHLSMDATNQDCGTPIQLGCCCKDDLAAAHKQCAETWFKIKGNKTCEICGSIAQNVAGINEAELMEEWHESNDAAVVEMTNAPPQSQSRNFWHGHRLLNFLLACMVFAFVISWLFHFNVPS